MKTKDPSSSQEINKTGLEQILRSNQEIRQCVGNAANELASINQLLEKDEACTPSAELALHQNKAVEQKVTKAAADLNQVNGKLASTVSQRSSIESELVSVKSELAEARANLSVARIKVDMAQHLAMHDGLTGLPNRAAFERALKRNLIQAKRHGWGLALLFIDIDKFKGINDAFGHLMGDQVLLTVARRLASAVRGEDVVSRWGGDEFVCLLLNINQPSAACVVAEELVARIAETCEFNETAFTLKASIGIAIYPTDGETAETLFKNADTAMYAAKGTNNRVVPFCEAGAMQAPQEGT